MEQPRRATLVKAMLATGRPERLVIRKCQLFGVVIEGPDGLPIGGTFPSLEAAHKAHSAAYIRAWDLFDPLDA